MHFTVLPILINSTVSNRPIKARLCLPNLYYCYYFYIFLSYFYLFYFIFHFESYAVRLRPAGLFGLRGPGRRPDAP